MKRIYLSAFCTDFRDYDRLEALVRAEENVGVELGTSWHYPEFDALLDAQQQRLADIPVTLHAPFVEICGAPDGEERRDMERRFQRAFRWYGDFHAASMVMHTHEKTVLPEKKAQMQEYTRQAICAVAQEARRKSVRLTVENVGYPAKGNVLFDQEEFIALFGDLPPEVDALIDTGHAMANGWDIPAVVERLGARIGAFHLHNTDGVHDLHRPLFETGLCYAPRQAEELLRVIRQRCPTAALILEYAPGPCITHTRIHSDIERIRRIWE